MTEGISLGWNCKSATHGVSNGIRKTKAMGYKTCPFDEMVTNYQGIIQCIEDDFKYFCDPDYLKIIIKPNEDSVINTKYKFNYNHESPGHADLYIKERWPKGRNHFVMNNYEEFIIRYTNRINNFREYLNSGKKINFIITRPNTSKEDLLDLTNVLKKKYPLLEFDYKILDDDKEFYITHMLALGIDKDDDEIKRLKIV
jgi:hypothetical protein